MTNAWSQLLPSALSASPTLCVVGAILLVVFVGAILVDAVLLLRCRRDPPDWKACFERLKRQPWTWDDAGLLFLTILLLVASFSWCHHIVNRDLPVPSPVPLPPGLLLGQSFAPHLAALILIVVLIRRRRGSWREAFGLGEGRMRRDVGRAIVFYLAAWPPLLVLTLVYLLALLASGVELHRQDVVQLLVRPDLPLWFKVTFAGIAVTLIPVAEELVFRGLNMSAASKLVGPVATVAITSLFFAGLHGQVTQFVPLFIIATAFSLAYLYTGNIVVPIVMHGIFNAMGILGSLLVKDPSGKLPLGLLLGG